MHLKIHEAYLFFAVVFTYQGSLLLFGIFRLGKVHQNVGHSIHVPDHEYFLDDAVSVCFKGENFLFGNLSFTLVIIGVFGLTVFH